jgi:predicted  nucleic acid-binding Zn-ribbon protein
MSKLYDNKKQERAEAAKQHSAAQQRAEALRNELAGLQEQRAAIQGEIDARTPALEAAQAAAIRTATKADDKAAAKMESEVNALRTKADRLTAAIKAVRADIEAAEAEAAEAHEQTLLCDLATVEHEARLVTAKFDTLLDELVSLGDEIERYHARVNAIRRQLGKNATHRTVGGAGDIAAARIASSMNSRKFPEAHPAGLIISPYLDFKTLEMKDKPGVVPVIDAESGDVTYQKAAPKPQRVTVPS